MISVSNIAGINIGLLYSWIKKYDSLGYNSLINQKKGRKANYPDMKKNNIKKPNSEPLIRSFSFITLFLLLNMLNIISPLRFIRPLLQLIFKSLIIF